MEQREHMSTKQAVVGIVGRAPPNDQTRVAKWDAFARETAQRAQILGNAGEVEDAKCLANSVEGGNCPRCDAPWEKVKVDNLWVMGVRYRPTCECLPRWTEKERKFSDGSISYETQEPKEVLYAAKCDGCRKYNVVMNHQRRHKGYRGHHAIYERVFCASCSKGKDSA